MPSTEPRASRPRTLARQLTWTLAITSALAATVALLAATLLADALIRAHVERGALATASVLVAELDEEPELVDSLAEEAIELGIGDRIAVFRGGAPWSGDPGLRPPADEEECGVVEGLETPELVCVRRPTFDDSFVVLVGVPADRAYGHRGALGIAAALVLVVVVVIAWVVAVARARRLIAPVQRLQEAVGAMHAEAGVPPVFPPVSRLEEVDALRTALLELIGRLEAENARSRRFAANAAHELRTPLTKLSAELELAREAPPEGSELADLLSRLQRTTGHMVKLTERLLLLATPVPTLDATEGTSMAALVDALGELRGAPERERLRLDPGAADGLVRGDPVLLAAVLDNVVDNALKFSEGPVDVVVRQREGHVVLEVTDDGPGVPAAQRDALFEPFRRGQGVHGVPGHGLGLALVVHVVRACHGEVSFVAREGRGACLRITLHLHDPVAHGESAPIRNAGV